MVCKCKNCYIEVMANQETINDNNQSKVSEASMEWKDFTSSSANVLLQSALLDPVLASIKYEDQYYVPSYYYFDKKTIRSVCPNYFLINQHECERMENMGHFKYEQLTSYKNYANAVQDHIKVELVMRAISSSNDFHIFTDDILEILQIIMKRGAFPAKNYEGRMRNFRESWDTKNIHFFNSITVTAFKNIMEELKIDKKMITIAPDLISLSSTHKLIYRKALEDPHIWTLSSNGRLVFSRDHALFYIFQMLICGVKWNNDWPKATKAAIEDFKTQIFGIMKTILKLKPGVFIAQHYVDEKVTSMKNHEIHTKKMVNQDIPIMYEFNSVLNEQGKIPYDFYKARSVDYGFDVHNALIGIEMIPIWLVNAYIKIGFMTSFLPENMTKLKNIIVEELAFTIPKKFQEERKKEMLEYINRKGKPSILREDPKASKLPGIEAEDDLNPNGMKPDNQDVSPLSFPIISSGDLEIRCSLPTSFECLPMNPSSKSKASPGSTSPETQKSKKNVPAVTSDGKDIRKPAEFLEYNITPSEYLSKYFLSSNSKQNPVVQNSLKTPTKKATNESAIDEKEDGTSSENLENQKQAPSKTSTLDPSKPSPNPKPPKNLFPNEFKDTNPDVKDGKDIGTTSSSETLDHGQSTPSESPSENGPSPNSMPDSVANVSHKTSSKKESAKVEKEVTTSSKDPENQNQKTSNMNPSKPSQKPKTPKNPYPNECKDTKPAQPQSKLCDKCTRNGQKLLEAQAALLIAETKANKYEEKAMKTMQMEKDMKKIRKENEELKKELEKIKNELKDSNEREEKSKETIQKLNEKVEDLELQVKREQQRVVNGQQENAQLNHRIEAIQLNFALKQSQIEQEFVKKDTMIHKLRRMNQSLLSKSSGFSALQKEGLTSSESPNPNPEEIGKSVRWHLIKWQKLKDKINMDLVLEEQKKMIEKLISITQDREVKNFVEYELIHFESTKDIYLRTVEMNIQKIKKLDDVTHLYPIPDYPKLSSNFLDKFAEEMKKQPQDLDVGLSAYTNCYICFEPYIDGDEKKTCKHCEKPVHVECDTKWRLAQKDLNVADETCGYCRVEEKNSNKKNG